MAAAHWILALQSDGRAAHLPEALTWLWDRTTREDQTIILRNSDGVLSRFFEPGPYHPEQERLCIEFVDWYLDALERTA